MQIIVLGPHRSGTSLLTRLINMTGAYFGVGAASIGFNHDNPKGFWERRDVVEINDEILTAAGCSWEQLYNWRMDAKPSKKTVKNLEEIGGKMKHVLLELDANRPWVVKDPRMCLTYPYWKQHLELPVIVSMTRNPVEVAMSLKSRNKFPLHHGLAIWEYYTVGMINAMRGAPAIHISHQDIISDPYGSLEPLLDKLQKAGVDGLRMPKKEEVETFIEPTLYHSKAGHLNAEELLTPYQQDLYDMAQGKKKLADSDLHPSELVRHIMEFRKELIEDEEKLLEAHRNIAALNQHLNEKEQHLIEYKSETERLQKCENDLQAALDNKHRESERLESFIRDIKHSTSWKIGNVIARFLRLITFQRARNES